VRIRESAPFSPGRAKMQGRYVLEDEGEGRPTGGGSLELEPARPLKLSRKKKRAHRFRTADVFVEKDKVRAGDGAAAPVVKGAPKAP
jgi:hypothetical protein